MSVLSLKTLCSITLLKSVQFFSPELNVTFKKPSVKKMTRTIRRRLKRLSNHSVMLFRKKEDAETMMDLVKIRGLKTSEIYESENLRWLGRSRKVAPLYEFRIY